MLMKDDIEIQRLNPEETYMYLGIKQGFEMKTFEAKTTFKKNFWAE